MATYNVDGKTYSTYENAVKAVRGVRDVDRQATYDLRPEVIERKAKIAAAAAEQQAMIDADNAAAEGGA